MEEIEFKYMTIDQIDIAAKLLGSKSDETREEYINNYTPINLGNVKFIYLPQILFCDLFHFNDLFHVNCYSRDYKIAYGKYGDKFADLIFAKDLDKITLNIKNVLKPIIEDTEYDSIKIRIPNISNYYGIESMYPNLIYFTILNNFTLYRECHEYKENDYYTIIIFKPNKEKK